MNTAPFQFDRRIDTGILYSLYENDYLFIEEIFKTILKHYDEDVQAFKGQYLAGNLEELKKAAHKIKPVFGYIGLPDVQRYCGDFEEECAKAEAIEEIRPDCEQLLQQFAECKQLIESDLQKLSDYNNNAA